MVNIVSKVHERVKQNNIKNYYQYKQLEGHKDQHFNILKVNNILITSIIIKSRREENKNAYLFFADAVKFCEKFQLRDCVIEIKALGYKNIDLKMLCELNKTTVKTAFGVAENADFEKLIKTG